VPLSNPHLWQPTLPERVVRSLLWRLSPAYGKRFERRCRERAALPRLEADIRSFRAASGGSSLPEQIAQIFRAHSLAPAQVPAELTALAEVVAARRPRTVLEIGGLFGGTLAAWTLTAADDARLISVDLEYTSGRRRCLAALARGRQAVECLTGDSTAPATLDAVRRRLDGRPLEFLYVDGDHAWDGVRADYDNFRPLLAPDAVVAFHDIQEDRLTREGVRTLTWAGDVPRFWRALRAAYPGKAREFIAAPDQDGYGLGVLCGGPWPEAPKAEAP
jgi:predicted O-methyltransferase YrrM